MTQCDDRSSDTTPLTNSPPSKCLHVQPVGPGVGSAHAVRPGVRCGGARVAGRGAAGATCCMRLIRNHAAWLTRGDVHGCHRCGASSTTARMPASLSCGKMMWYVLSSACPVPQRAVCVCWVACVPSLLAYAYSGPLLAALGESVHGFKPLSSSAVQKRRHLVRCCTSRCQNYLYRTTHACITHPVPLNASTTKHHAAVACLYPASHLQASPTPPCSTPARTCTQPRPRCPWPPSRAAAGRTSARKAGQRPSRASQPPPSWQRLPWPGCSSPTRGGGCAGLRLRQWQVRDLSSTANATLPSCSLDCSSLTWFHDDVQARRCYASSALHW